MTPIYKWLVNSKIDPEEIFRLVDETDERRIQIPFRVKESIVSRFRNVCRGKSPSRIIEVLLLKFIEECERLEDTRKKKPSAK